MQYWNYAAVARPCKCPMCVRHITKLSPEASLQQRHEQEVKEVLDKVRRYNRLFVGGLTGFAQVMSFDSGFGFGFLYYLVRFLSIHISPYCDLTESPFF